MLATRKSNTVNANCYGIDKVLLLCIHPFWSLQFTRKSLFNVNNSDPAHVKVRKSRSILSRMIGNHRLRQTDHPIKS